MLADLLAARAERMPDAIGAGEADAEHVDAARACRAELFNERRGQAAEVRVGERAALPLRLEVGVRRPDVPFSTCGNVAVQPVGGVSPAPSSAVMRGWPSSGVQLLPKSASTGWAAMKRWTSGTGAAANADDVIQPSPASLTTSRRHRHGRPA